MAEDEMPVAQIGDHSEDVPTMQTEEALIAAILSYQSPLPVEGAAIQPDIHEPLMQARAAQLETIFYLIAPNLRRLAGRYYGSERVCQEIRSSVAHNAEDLLQVIAFDMFYYVIEALPKVKPDPNKNIVGLLITIADRGWKNDRIYHPSASMISLDIAHDEAALADEAALTPVDDRLQHQNLRQLLLAFRAECDPMDRWVLDGRLASPPTAFAELAQRLGSGHTEAMLRKRWSRMRRRLIAYLKLRDAL
jgi:hypothetical protein